MKVIITGLGGTVAPFAAKALEENGHTIVRWDRSVTPTDDYEKIKTFILNGQPGFVFHIGMGREQWARDMADVCFKNGVGFLFTSTVDVLSDKCSGPYTVESAPYSVTEYGKYKLRCESLIKDANPDAYIVRLGWQVGKNSGSNNMVDFLAKQMKEQGIVRASCNWYPSCSYLWDTGEALYRAVNTLPPDTYLFNANIDMSFYEIACLLQREHPEFKIEKVSDFVRDDRMRDNRLPAKYLFSR